MALFTVVEPPDGRPEKAVIIREEFSVRALVFSVFWALWHRMWIVAAVLFAVYAVLELSTVMFRLDQMIVFFASLAVSLLFGFEARNLQIMSLQRAGYSIAAVVAADSEASAELQYFSERASSEAQQPAALARSNLSASSQHHDALGLFGSH